MGHDFPDFCCSAPCCNSLLHKMNRISPRGPCDTVCRAELDGRARAKDCTSMNAPDPKLKRDFSIPSSHTKGGSIGRSPNGRDHKLSHQELMCATQDRTRIAAQEDRLRRPGRKGSVVGPCRSETCGWVSLRWFRWSASVVRPKIKPPMTPYS